MALTGKIAIVSGATRGIGKAIAKKLLANGANVAICGRNEELLKDLQTENLWPLKLMYRTLPIVKRLLMQLSKMGENRYFSE